MCCLPQFPTLHSSLSKKIPLTLHNGTTFPEVGPFLPLPAKSQKGLRCLLRKNRVARFIT